MHNTAIRHGILAAIIMIFIILIPVLLFKDSYNMDIGEIIGYSTMVIAMTMVFFGIKRYRDKELGGKISFGRAFKAGIYISAIGAFIFGAATSVFYEVTDFGENYKEYYIEKITSESETSEAAQQKLKEFNDYYEAWDNSFLQGVVMFGTVFFIGAVIALVSAAILRKNPETIIT